MLGNPLEDVIASRETPGTRHFPPFAVTPELAAAAAASIARYPVKRSAALPLLHLVQQRHGFISAEAVDWVAAQLELAPIQVAEVVTFYPGFRQSAPGKYHLRVCRTLSCAMGGSHELMAHFCELTGIDLKELDPHHHPVAVSPCGLFSVEFAECLASCGSAPVCMVNDDFHEGVTHERAAAIIAGLRARHPAPGS